MKWGKYLLSGIAILLATLLVMLLPNVYQQYIDRPDTPAEPRDILLEQTIQKPTASEMLRLILDSLLSGNRVTIEVMGDKTVNGEDGYTADCRQILRNVFGKQEESKATALLLETLEQGKNIQIRTYQLVMLSGSNVITTNIVEAKYDALSIVYEEDHQLALQITFDSRQLNTGSQADTLFPAVMEQSSSVEDYYRALGLQDGEFALYTQSDSGFVLGVRPNEQNEQEHPSIEATLPLLPYEAQTYIIEQVN